MAGPHAEAADAGRSEEELMAAYVAGDRAAFDELFQRLAPVLLRVLARQLPNREEANDLVQQTFLQLHRSRNDFREGARLRPWLFTIAINLKREHFRRMKRRPEAPLELDGRSDPVSVQGAHGRADAQHSLGWALQRIPTDQAEVIALHWFEGLAFPEVAEVVGASLSAVKVRAHRGYQALRALLDESVGQD
ncbi:MAG: sigma-70 family RNA polymerase sigma factor [Polyangiaceae bacterium]